MWKNKKYFSVIAIVLLCVSCGESKTRLFLDDLNTYCFTKWVRNDGEFYVYIEGKRTPNAGFGYYKNMETRCLVLTANYLTKLAMIIRGQDGDNEYDLSKVLNESGNWDGVIRAYDSSIDKEYYFTPEPISIENININNFQLTNLISEDATYRFNYRYDSIYSQKNLWTWKCEEETYYLTFNDDKTFIIENNKKKTTGTYITDFDVVTLSVDVDELSLERNEIKLYYEYGYE